MYGTLERKEAGGELASGEQALTSSGGGGAKMVRNESQSSSSRWLGESAGSRQRDRERDQQQQRQRKRKIFSHCHMASDESGGAGIGSNELPQADASARRRLIVASVICLIFMIGEVVGGVLSGSLAIATDAAHLLTDFASFMISLFAIWLSTRPASRKMSFGWYRAEVIGALLSVLMIWLVTGLLVYMAVERLRTGEFEIDATVMVVTASAGLLVNIIMAIALNVDGHGHGHFHAHGHGHGHAHGHGHGHAHEANHEHGHDLRNHSHLIHVNDEADDDDDDERALERSAGARKRAGELAELSLPNGAAGAAADNCAERPAAASQAGRGKANINVRAAFIHVIGDFLQSLGVLIAALVIYFEPSYAIVDPICTFLFSIIVLVTTLNIIRDATNVLMEGIPDGINFLEVREKLQTLPGVVRVHNLRIWSLSLDKIAISTHLVIDTSQVGSAQALKKAIETLKSSYSFFEVTIQIEEYREDMRDCERCQDDNDDDDDDDDDGNVNHGRGGGDSNNYNHHDRGPPDQGLAINMNGNKQQQQQQTTTAAITHPDDASPA